MSEFNYIIIIFTTVLQTVLSHPILLSTQKFIISDLTKSSIYKMLEILGYLLVNLL